MKNKVLLAILAVLCLVGIYLILISDVLSVNRYRYGAINQDTKILADAPVFICTLDENNDLIISHPDKAYPDILDPKEKILRLSLNDVINISESVVIPGGSSECILDDSAKTAWLSSLSKGAGSNLHMISTVPGGTSIYRTQSDKGHYTQIEFIGEYNGTLVLHNGQDEYAFVPVDWTNIDEVANQALLQLDKLIVSVVVTIILVGIGVYIQLRSKDGSRVLKIYVFAVVTVIILSFFIFALREGIFQNWDSLPNKVIL